MIRWDTDRRPPSLVARVYSSGMRIRRDKDAFEGASHTLMTARRLQRSGDHGPTLLTRLLRRVEEDEQDDMVVWTVGPRRRRAVARVMYVHGGGYVHPLTADYWRLARALTRAPADVVVPAYPLAPDATLDDALPRLLDVYEDLVAADPELPVLLMGDSAGGALVLAMALRLRDVGGPPPAAVVALSPWLDARLDEPEVGSLEVTDPMLAESGLRAAGRWWAGVRGADDPLVSPVHGRLVDLPPLVIYVGDRDILRPAVDAFAEQAARDGANLHVHELCAMFHVWMTRAIPEGRRTRRELVQIIRRRAAAP
jgi:epsilon-lactone hydrolase